MKLPSDQVRWGASDATRPCLFRFLYNPPTVVAGFQEGPQLRPIQSAGLCQFTQDFHFPQVYTTLPMGPRRGVVELVIPALFFGVGGGLMGQYRVWRPMGASYSEANATSAFLHFRRDISFRFAVTYRPQLAVSRPIRSQQEGTAVQRKAEFFGKYVEPAQADVTIGSSIVVPHGDFYRMGCSHRSPGLVELKIGRW